MHVGPVFAQSADDILRYKGPDREQKLIELMADDVTDNHSNGRNRTPGFN